MGEAVHTGDLQSSISIGRQPEYAGTLFTVRGLYRCLQRWRIDFMTGFSCS